MEKVTYTRIDSPFSLSSLPTVWQVRENLGTVLLSLCYSPESKKLSVIILRARDLNKGVAKDIGES